MRGANSRTLILFLTSRRHYFLTFRQKVKAKGLSLPRKEKNKRL